MSGAACALVLGAGAYVGQDRLLAKVFESSAPNRRRPVDIGRATMLEERPWRAREVWRLVGPASTTVEWRAFARTYGPRSVRGFICLCTAVLAGAGGQVLGELPFSEAVEGPVPRDRRRGVWRDNGENATAGERGSAFKERRKAVPE